MPSASDELYLDSQPHAHAPDGDAPPAEAKPLSPEARAAIFGRMPPPARDDPERLLFADYGPHEIWENDPAPEQAAAATKAKLARLEEADAAAQTLEGELANAPKRCPAQDETRALEVELRDAAGPLRGVKVVLRRTAPAGTLTGKSDAQGLVRFEGLLPGDQHQLSLPTLAPSAWKIATTASLPRERAVCWHEAPWSAPAKDDAGTETRHEVASGECMWTLAQAHDYDQATLWSANPELQAEGRLANVLAPGDMVVLPAKQAPTSADARAGTRVTIEVTAQLPRARLSFQDPEGKPRAGLGFVARVVTADGSEQVWEGTTDGKGGLDESVPADARTLDVVLKLDPEPEGYHFCFGHLDPLKTLAGVQGRLLNLGYDCGDERGELGPLTRRSLRDFQHEHELPETGEPDEATLAKLETLYKR